MPGSNSSYPPNFDLFFFEQLEDWKASALYHKQESERLRQVVFDKETELESALKENERLQLANLHPQDSSKKW